jgi:predicted DNA binding CopG/RHH family protein
MKKKKENVPQKTRDAEKREIRVYDSHDTTSYIDRKKAMTLAGLGIELPPETPTKVLSLRLPTTLLNKIKAYAGQHDVPYSAMIKMILAEGIESKIRNGSHVGKR